MRPRSLIGAVVGLVLLLSASPALAQFQTQAGNILSLKASAVTIANTTTAANLYSDVVPAVVSTRAGQLLAGATSIHVKILGALSTNVAVGGAGSINVGCNYGGSTATITLVNALVLDGSLSSQPFTIDLWLRAQGSSQILQGKFELVNPIRTGSSQVATTTTTSAVVTGTTSMTSAQTILCAWQWASTGASNSVVANNGIMVVGE